MGRILNLILAVILLISCSGCFWDAEHDRGYHDERDRGGMTWIDMMKEGIMRTPVAMTNIAKLMKRDQTSEFW